jgi:HEPN domain-containing protein
MTDFTKNKIAFAIALLAALFALSPVTLNLGSTGFSVFQQNIKILYLYYFISLFLTLAVYFYGIQFLTERPLRFAQILGDISYAIAIVAPVLYFSVYFVIIITDALSPIIKSDTFQSWIKGLLSAIMGALSVYLSNWFRAILAKREKQSASEQSDKETISFLDRAKKLFDDGHYDLVVVECYKSIEVAAKKALAEKGIVLKGFKSITLIDSAQKAGVIPEDRISLVNEIRILRNQAAHGAKSLSKEDASLVLEATRRVLASMVSPDQDENT